MAQPVALKEARLAQERPARHPRRTWSGRRFALCWRRAKKRNPALKTMDLATPCKVTPGTLYNWRKGIGRPGYDEIYILADLLECDPDEFGDPVE